MPLLAHYPGVNKPTSKSGGADRATPPAAKRTQITVTVNSHFLDRLDTIGREIGRNRSEMIDRAIEDYVSRQPPPAQLHPHKK